MPLHGRSLFLQYFVDTAQIEAETHQPLPFLGGIHGLCGAYNPIDSELQLGSLEQQI
jgi:hypothetical protein